MPILKLFSSKLCLNFALISLLAPPAWAGCTDISDGSSFTLTRHSPLFEVTNTISNDGTVREDRRMLKNGKIQTVTTRYWSGIVATDRKSSSSHLKLKLMTNGKSIDLASIGKRYTIPLAIIANGQEIDRGSIEITPIRRTQLDIGAYRYPVIVVRKSIKRKNGHPINEEALFSLEAGMILGNVAMSPDWQAKHGVFYDALKPN